MKNIYRSKPCDHDDDDETITRTRDYETLNVIINILHRNNYDFHLSNIILSLPVSIKEIIITSIRR